MIALDSLNPEQRAAVVNYQGPAMILAGAGTGKTRVVTARIAYMVGNGIAPERIAAMTFTNKAAKEMKERIRAILGQKKAQAISITTFHSFCLKLLRTYGSDFGVPNRLVLLGAGDQLDLVRKALEEKGWTSAIKPDDLLYQIGMCKNWLISPDDFEGGRRPSGIKIDAPTMFLEGYRLYERQLVLNRAMDFDDCILKVVFGLKANPELIEKLRHRYHYFLVDEFQDTNASQFEIIELLAGASKNICVVGDDDQSIYSWRGAMFETLSRFETVFAGTNVIKLEQNYRCSNVILKAANAVIANNTKRKSKELWSQSEITEPIVLGTFESALEEAQWIADSCLTLKNNGTDLEKIAVLYRANNQSKLIEMALRERGLYFKTFGGQSFFERKEIRDFLSYLRLINNPEDHLALWRVINTPPRGIGLKTQELIEEYAKKESMPPFNLLRSRLLDGKVTDATFESILLFLDEIRELAQLDLATPADFAHLGNQIIEKFGLVQYIKETTKNQVSSFKKIANLQSLPGWLEKAATEYVSDHLTMNAKDLLDQLTLTEAPSGSNDREERRYISLMTVHSAKGLEFPCVFISGMEEGLLPHHNSLGSPAGISEERRLFYVALTRAKERCFLSHAQFRERGKQKEFRTISRFITEIPDQQDPPLVRRLNNLNLKEEEGMRKEQTVARLSKLRLSLSSSAEG